MAYTKPQQRKKEESERRRGERDQIKFRNADLNVSTNRMIIEATISFIEKKRWFG